MSDQIHPYLGAWVFSTFSKLGPEPILSYPPPVDELKVADVQGRLTSHHYLLVAIKSISLLLRDTEDEEQLKKVHLFGMLPYPDFESIGLTYFTYHFDYGEKKYIPVSFTLLVHESSRSFIYDNSARLEKVIIDFTNYILNLLIKEQIPMEQAGGKLQPYVQQEVLTFINQIQKIQSHPINPISSQRRIKILFTGLEGTGKKAFINLINRKYSEVIGSSHEIVDLTPNAKSKLEPINLLGTTILTWDLPFETIPRKKMFQKSEMYLFDTDLIYYFIDVKDPRLEPSKECLGEITSKLKMLYKQKPIPPIFVIITNVDPDIAHSPPIRTSVENIQRELTNIAKDFHLVFFETSVFSFYSILNALSYGIRLLSPNRELIEHLLNEFMVKHNQLLAFLLNENGLVLANYEIVDPKYKQILNRHQIFELTAPSFTMVARQFSHYLPKSVNLTEYNLSDEDIVLLKGFIHADLTFFLLFYSKDRNSKPKLVRELPQLEEKIKNLVQYYLS